MSPLDYLQLVFVGVDQFWPIAVGLILWTGLAGLGVLATGRNGVTEANPIFGWAAISTVFTLVGVIQRAPFFILSVIAGGGAVTGVIMAWRCKQALFFPGMWRVIVLALPIFLIAGAMEPSQWDEFSHWLPAPNYLLEINGFPNAEKPNNGPQMLSAYPYGWPMLSYLAGRIAGQQLLNIGGILNILMLLTFTPLAVRTVMELFGKPFRQPIGWGMAAVCCLFATIFNPTFVQKIVLTAYSGVSTSIVTGFCVLLTYYFLQSMREANRLRASQLAWQLSLALMLLVNLRQPNLVIFLVICAALLVLALRERDLSLRHTARFLPLIGGPALIVYFAWRQYVGIELATFGDVEATFKPLELWNTKEIPEILAQMVVVAGKKIGFFGTMILVTLFALVGMIKMRSGIDRLLVICAAIFAGYNLFLFFTYVAHFSPQNALSVVSYWRYNTQIGAVAIISILLGAVYVWNKYLGLDRILVWPARLAIILVVALPIGFAPKLRFDLEAPKPHYNYVAKDLKTNQLIGGDLYVMDPRGTGEAAVMTRFHLGMRGTAWFSGFSSPTPEKIRMYLDQLKENDLLLVHSISDGLEKALGYPLDARRSYVFRQTKNGWKMAKDWQKPANHPY